MSIREPLVSVVVPIYNKKAYIRRCVESILAQDYPALELILVDDASADGSLAVAEKLAHGEHRIRLMRHETNRGAGAARNTGLSAARGEYVLFLDADDLYEPSLLTEAVAAAEETGADVVLYGADHYIDGEDRCEPAPEMLRAELLPESRPFTAADAPETLFQLCTPEVWNKLFRRDFLLDNGLRFQELPNTNDLFLALGAMALGRIAAVEKTLVHYRVGGAGIQAGKAGAPLAFREALRALGELLRERGLYPMLERSYRNLALFHINFNYRGMRQELSGALRELYHEFGVDAAPASYFSPLSEYEQYVENICGLADFDAFREDVHPDFFRVGTARGMRAAAENREKYEAAEEEIDRIHRSASYRIGRLVTAPVRALRDHTSKENL